MRVGVNTGCILFLINTTFSLTDTPKTPFIMNLSRLLALIDGLRPHQRTDLMAFLVYRQQATALPGRLLVYFLNTDRHATKADACLALKITDGSFRTGKSELVKLIVAWRSLNTTSGNAPELHRLLAAQTFLEWGETKQALKLTDTLQQQAECESRYAMARLGLELRSAMVLRSFGSEEEKEMKFLMQEKDRLDQQDSLLARSSHLYAKMAALLRKGTLLRLPERLAMLHAIETELNQNEASATALNLYQWAFHVQTQALVAHTNGDTDRAHASLLPLWLRLRALKSLDAMCDQRFFRFFLHFIELGIRCGDMDNAYVANCTFRCITVRYYGSDQRLLALHQVFADLILLQCSSNIIKCHNGIRKTVNLLHKAGSDEDRDFDISGWEPYMRAAALPLLIQTCFDQQLLKEAAQLIGMARLLNGSNTGTIIDLQALAPLIYLAIRYETLLLARADRSTDTYFEADTLYCYHHFRKHQTTHPIEWTLTRLFYGLYSGKKTPDLLFSETSSAMAQHSHQCHYFGALMLIFDFNSWIGKHALAMVQHSPVNSLVQRQ